jgi:hypothetical protein
MNCAGAFQRRSRPRKGGEQVCAAGVQRARRGAVRIPPSGVGDSTEIGIAPIEPGEVFGARVVAKDCRLLDHTMTPDKLSPKADPATCNPFHEERTAPRHALTMRTEFRTPRAPGERAAFAPTRRVIVLISLSESSVPEPSQPVDRRIIGAEAGILL